MVAPTKVGKQRSFGRGLLLTIVTFGIYSIYWNYKAHNEVFEQFELTKEGRDEGILFFIFGLIIGVVFWIFQYKAVENINYVRGRLGLAPGVSGGAFLLWSTIGILIIVGPFVAYSKYQRSINDVWDRYDQRSAELRASGQQPAELAPLM